MHTDYFMSILLIRLLSAFLHQADSVFKGKDYGMSTRQGFTITSKDSTWIVKNE